MSAAAAYRPAFDLPWETGRIDSRNFNRWLLVCLLFVVTAGVTLPLLPVPEVEREELEELPPQLARILLKKEPPPPPPPPPPKVKEQVKPEPKPEPKEPPKPVVKPDPVVAPPQPKVADAREKAAISGLLAFKDAFADMREAVDTSKLTDTAAIQRGADSAPTVDRALLTSKRSSRSSGVNVAALSTQTGGVALSGRETTKVEAPKTAERKGSTRKQKAIDARERSIEDIRRIFDANKGAIFAIYNRALRRDPSLQGKVLLELVIDPSGQVAECRVLDSEITDDAVVAKIVNRVKLFDFGSRQVSRTRISYPVHFLPT
ncbi:MAG: AgmX/PglI C-terminal domain-containing protein [Pseudomonadota bacterium]